MADTPPDLLTQLASTLGIDAATATPDTVLATLTARLGDAAKVTTERDAALSEVAKIKGEAEAARSAAATARIDAAIQEALPRSLMRMENAPDAASLLRPMLEVTAKGEVRTKADVPNVIPGLTVADAINGHLRSARPHWWGVSVGAGAKGGGWNTSNLPGDTSCFDPARANLTLQLQYEARYGADAARRAAARYGVKLGGGR